MRLPLRKRANFVKMFSGAVATQAMISASSFLVGLMFVRRTSDVQYGDYVLIATTVLLAISLQGSFIGPPLVIRLTGADKQERTYLVGSLYRDQRRILLLPIIAAAIFFAGLLFRRQLDLSVAATLMGGLLATLAALRRDFLRTTLFAYERPNDVLKSDSAYSVLLVLGAYAATFLPWAAAAAGLTMAIACTVGGRFLSRSLWRHEPWNADAPSGVLRAIAPLGAWSAFGSGVHWIFSQGYNYLVAGMLDVRAVAALAATRLLVMPVNLLSTGIAALLLPTATRWQRDLPPMSVLRRLALASTAIAAIACVYLMAMWLARDWIFSTVLRKHLAHRDSLLRLWMAICVVMVFRDQMLHFLVARARFRLTSTITLISATTAVGGCVVAIRAMGVEGALLGLLGGELFNVLGIVVLSLYQALRPPPARAVGPEPTGTS